MRKLSSLELKEQMSVISALYQLQKMPCIQWVNYLGWIWYVN